MTVLVDHEIMEHINNGDIRITPYDRFYVQPNSYDVRLDNTFLESYDDKNFVIDPYNANSVIKSCNKVTLSKGGLYYLNPKDFVLGTTIETIGLPNNICAEVNGKSSLARLGLSIHQTGGWIDCGFEGQITLEIHNCNKYPIALYPGMPIAQLVFHKTAPCKIPYCDRLEAKYQGQKGVVGSRYYMNHCMEGKR